MKFIEALVKYGKKTLGTSQNARKFVDYGRKTLKGYIDYRRLKGQIKKMMIVLGKDKSQRIIDILANQKKWENEMQELKSQEDGKALLQVFKDITKVIERTNRYKRNMMRLAKAPAMKTRYEELGLKALKSAMGNTFAGKKANKALSTALIRGSQLNDKFKTLSKVYSDYFKKFKLRYPKKGGRVIRALLRETRRFARAANTKKLEKENRKNPNTNYCSVNLNTDQNQLKGKCGHKYNQTFCSDKKKPYCNSDYTCVDDKKFEKSDNSNYNWKKIPVECLNDQGAPAGMGTKHKEVKKGGKKKCNVKLNTDSGAEKGRCGESFGTYCGEKDKPYCGKGDKCGNGKDFERSQNMIWNYSEVPESCFERGEKEKKMDEKLKKEENKLLKPAKENENKANENKANENKANENKANEPKENENKANEPKENENKAKENKNKPKENENEPKKNKNEPKENKNKAKENENKPGNENENKTTMSGGEGSLKKKVTKHVKKEKKKGK